MPIRFIGVALLVTLTLLCSGCYGAKETDAVAYVLLIGVDKAADGKQKVTYQVAVPRALGSDSTETGGQKKNRIINSTLIRTPAEASMLINSTMSRYRKLNHTVAFIYSEKFAREVGIGASLSYNIRSPVFRETLFLIVVPGTAEEYIRQNQPTLETTISKFYETFLASAGKSGYYLPASLHEFNTRLKNGGASPYAIYSGINPMTGEDKPAGSKTPEQKGIPYLPGGVPRTGTENPVDLLGLAVFQGEKMIGVLNSDETRAVALLQGKFAHGYVGVADPLQPQKDAVSLKVYCDTKPKITADLNGGLPVFNVNVEIEGELLGITSGINYEASGYRELLEAQIANLFKGQIMSMLKHTQELGTDPVGFGLYLRPKFHDTNELEQANMSALYRTADIRVNVTAKIRRTGLLWRTTPQKE